MKQLIEGQLRGFAQTAVHRRYLNDGTAWSNEPVKAFALGQLGDRAGIRNPLADRRERFEMAPNDVEVHIGPERAKAFLIHVHARPEEAMIEAEQYDTGVDELFAVDAGHDAQYGVIK
jgi:hypothetical protein